MWYVYLVRCIDASLYCGITNDVNKRVEKHNKGLGAKYTKTRGPVALVYVEEQPSKSDALKREWHIKHRLSKAEKKALVKSYEQKTS